MILEEQTWKKAREKFKEAKVALIPVGSTEQHGPHLPLGTDFLTVKALAEGAAARTGWKGILRRSFNQRPTSPDMNTS